MMLIAAGIVGFWVGVVVTVVVVPWALFAKDKGPDA